MSHNTFRCDETMKSALQAMVTESEILREIRSLPKNRSPSPDGYTREFYRATWDVIGCDVIKAVKEFFHSGQLLKQWNLTAIMLVPKTDSAVSLGDFRPISCCKGVTSSMASATQQGHAFSSSLSKANRLENIPQLVAGVLSEDRNLQLEATNGFRKLLSIEKSPPIDDVVQAGVVPRIVQFLSRDDFHELQFEAAWALTNIASGTSEDTKVIIDSGAVPLFVQLLSSPNDDVREQAVWALGNVAGDSPKCRDIALSFGGMAALLTQFNEHSKPTMLRNATWTLSNFCRGKPAPAFEKTQSALPVLEKLLHLNDEEILTDACWALSYLSDGDNEKIQTVIDSGVIPSLVLLLAHPSPSVLIPALRTIGNIVTGDDLQTQAVLNHQALPALLNLLTKTYKKSIKKETCWTISNITAGNASQIQEVIQAGIAQPLIQLLQNGEFEVKKEAVWAISNATSGGNHDQIKFLARQGCIKPLCDLLLCPDPRVVIVSLEGLENILKVGESEKNLGNTGECNLYAQMIEDAEGVEKIENLQSHDNTEIYEKAVKILESYWAEEDDDDECGVIAPENLQSSGFQFGNQNGNAPTAGFNFG